MNSNKSVGGLLPKNAFMVGFREHEFIHVCRNLKEINGKEDNDITKAVTEAAKQLGLEGNYETPCIDMEAVMLSQLHKGLEESVLNSLLYNAGRFAHFLLYFVGLPFIPYLNVAYYVDRQFGSQLTASYNAGNDEGKVFETIAKTIAEEKVAQLTVQKISDDYNTLTDEINGYLHNIQVKLAKVAQSAAEECYCEAKSRVKTVRASAAHTSGMNGDITVPGVIYKEEVEDKSKQARCAYNMVVQAVNIFRHIPSQNDLNRQEIEDFEKAINDLEIMKEDSLNTGLTSPRPINASRGRGRGRGRGTIIHGGPGRITGNQWKSDSEDELNSSNDE